MLDLIVGNLPLIISSILAAIFVGKFVAVKRIIVRLAKLGQTFIQAEEDKEWDDKELLAFGKDAVPLVKDLLLILKGILPTKTKI